MPTIRDRSKPFVPAPAGLHRAACVDVIDLGWQEDNMSNKLKPKIAIVWEIEEEMKEGGRFVVRSHYNIPQSLRNDRSSLVQDLTSWRGRKFNEDELKNFEIDNILGAACQINLIHAIVGDKTYANVDSIVPAHRDGKLIPSGKYKRAKDRDDWKAPAISAFDDLPEDKTAEPEVTDATPMDNPEIPF